MPQRRLRRCASTMWLVMHLFFIVLPRVRAHVYIMEGEDDPSVFNNRSTRRSTLATEQDYSLYGVVVHKDRLATYKEVTRNCFLGWGFKYCTSIGEPPKLAQYPFNWQDHIKMGEHFCIQCCDNKRQVSSLLPSSLLPRVFVAAFLICSCAHNDCP